MLQNTPLQQNYFHIFVIQNKRKNLTDCNLIKNAKAVDN